MSKKTSMYFPNYQLQREEADIKQIWFSYAGIYFIAKTPFFGATKTQKTALKWAAWKTPPVICVKHKAPITPDKDVFRDPYELHRAYYPYAMAIAILECLGEETSRKIKIYFCNAELHEDSQFTHKHLKFKSTYIVPLPA